MNIEEPLNDKQTKAVSVEVPDDDKLQKWFTYHPPTDGDIPKYREVRDSALAFARVIDACCPDGADKSASIRKIREAVMTANAGIACCGK